MWFQEILIVTIGVLAVAYALPAESNVAAPEQLAPEAPAEELESAESRWGGGWGGGYGGGWGGGYGRGGWGGGWRGGYGGYGGHHGGWRGGYGGWGRGWHG